MALPEFLRRGCDEKLALGALATGGTLGMLIPPSISRVVYAVTADPPSSWADKIRKSGRLTPCGLLVAVVRRTVRGR